MYLMISTRKLLNPNAHRFKEEKDFEELGVCYIISNNPNKFLVDYWEIQIIQIRALW